MKSFLAVLIYQCRAIKIDAEVYWNKRGDSGLMHAFLYVITCHGWHIMFLFRLGKIIYSFPIPIVSHLLKIIFRLINFLISTFYGISINPVSEIGPGFYIGHYGGIFIRGQIGEYCSISQGVTFGSKGAGKSNGWPVLEDNIYIGAGAKVIGNIHIGSYAVIGANAVVTQSVPSNALAVGVPANIKKPLKHVS